MRLQGKSAIITGAAAGIGAAAARRFRAEGARLLLVDRDAVALDRLAAELDSPTLPCDVTEDDSARAYLAAATHHFGQVDIALLNAGTEGTIAPLDQLGVAVFDHVMRTNVRSVWLGLEALLPAMRDRGGSIVITSSTAGLRGAKGLAAYNASKHAVIGLMRAAALEGAPTIRVNTVNPGPTETRMIQALDTAAGAPAADRKRRIPLQRYGDPHEIASLMLFLASDESAFCTGATYLADGGLLSGSTT